MTAAARPIFVFTTPPTFPTQLLRNRPARPACTFAATLAGTHVSTSPDAHANPSAGKVLNLVVIGRADDATRRADAGA